MIPNIEDVQNPVIGRFYWVPCVVRPKAADDWHWATEPYKVARENWLPVIGPWHEDAEHVGFEPHHFHYDWRFLATSIYQLWLGDDLPGRVFSRVHTGGPFMLNCPEPARTRRKLKMKREMPEFPLLSPRTGKLVHFIPLLEKAFAGQRLKCLVCPHQGLPLKGLPVKDGTVICPGHGLKWNVTTGELVVR